MPNRKRKTMAGRGAVGKTAAVGTKDRASNKVAARTDAPHVTGFVAVQTRPGAKVHTDEAAAYNALKPWYDHEAVNHSVGGYVRGQAHTNGMESFRAMPKRGCAGTFHRFGARHADRCIAEFAGRHNMRDSDAIDMPGAVAADMAGKRLKHHGLTR